MNRIIFEKDELLDDGTVRLPPTDRRFQHMKDVLKATVGNSFSAGVLNESRGKLEVASVGEGGIVARYNPEEGVEEPLFDLILAMPRPKVMHRLWEDLASLGVGRIVLVNAARVERFYFDSHWLDEATWRPLLVQGLEQSGGVKMPEVLVRRALKPFVEDELDGLFGNSPRYIAEPGDDPKGRVEGRPLVAVGPEGGWVQYELDMFAAAGFRRFSLGWRTLRTGVACAAIAGWISHG